MLASSDARPRSGGSLTQEIIRPNLSCRFMRGLYDPLAPGMLGSP